MSAITQRGKRQTAGRRITDLVGKAQEEDDTFWGHDTWAEDDSGNESFRDSDEDSAHKKDEFDSDFDDSESDHEEEEKATGAEEEHELMRQERSDSKAKGYTDTSTKRTIKGTGKRIVGNGINAGIVLNFPNSAGGAPLPAPAAAPLPSADAATTDATTDAATDATAVATAPPKSSPSKRAAKRLTMASTRTKRSATINKRLRESTTKASEVSKTSAKKSAKTGTNKRSGKRQFTQEELLLEAVHKTEPGNERWLLERKRLKDVEDNDKEAMALREKNKGPLIQKYHSKRGCLMTLTFPDMDSVPEILTRKKVELKVHKKSFCVITGKPARYMDPKTNLGYFDLAAFKQLRRRMEANEPLDQRTKAAPKAKAVTSPSNADGETKAALKPTPNGVAPTDVAPTTPLTTANVKTMPSDVAGGPDLPALSPSGRRSSPRSRKPSEKMRENIVSNPQLNNLKLSSSTTPTNPDLAVPDDNTKPSSPLPGPVPKTSPPPKPTTTTQPTPQQSDNETTSVGAKVKHATPPTKPKTTTAASTKRKAIGDSEQPAAKKLSGGESSDAADGKAYPVSDANTISQSQLIMQVINDFNKQHPEVKD